LREVERRSLHFAQETGNQSYQVSASWLNRLKREEHELTVNKLIVVADIYDLSIERLIRSLYPRDAQPLSLRQLSSPNATMLLTGRKVGKAGKVFVSDLLHIRCRVKLRLKHSKAARAVLAARNLPAHTFAA
jgi:hypothetical protein